MCKKFSLTGSTDEYTLGIHTCFAVHIFLDGNSRMANAGRVCSLALEKTGFLLVPK